MLLLVYYMVLLYYTFRNFQFSSVQLSSVGVQKSDFMFVNIMFNKTLITLTWLKF